MAMPLRESRIVLSIKTCKEEKQLNRIRLKLENGTPLTGFWDTSPHVPESNVPVITNRKVSALTHPTEDRYLSLREIISMMGLPEYFEVAKEDLQAVCKGVPCRTAEGVGKELV